MDGIVIQTNSGLVRGKQLTFNDHLKCYCFLGIPYAQPPLGNLRFLAPQPLESWTGVLDATEVRNDCLQLDVFTKECIGSEDCLYLNVFVPETEPRVNMPVLILINSWGFGSAKLSYYNPEYFIAENIIVVTFTFRIGPVGFLSACEPSAPGNAGLKDVLYVLRWVKTNISQFGGDPENITLFGSSGGSVIVDYLMLSKAARGLFHKGIAQSGSVLNPWAFTSDPLQMTCLMAEILGYKNTDPCTVTEFLKSVPAESLVSSCLEIVKRKKSRFFMIPFWPCLENEYEGQEAFLTKTPEQLVKSNSLMDIPYLTGFNRDEGFLFLVWDNVIDKDNLNDESLETFAAWTLGLDNKSYASAAITKKLSSFYLKNSSTCHEYKKKYTEVLTDFAIVESLNRFVKAATAKSRKTPFYYYMFEFFGPHTAIPKDLRNELKAVNHHDELAYLFQCFWDTSRDFEDCTLVRKRMISMWSNFIKFGDPTPNQNELLAIKWEPVIDPKELKFLKISNDLSMDMNPFEERMKFWESIHNDVKASRGQRYIDRQSNLGGIIK